MRPVPTSNKLTDLAKEAVADAARSRNGGTRDRADQGGTRRKASIFDGAFRFSRRKSQAPSVSSSLADSTLKKVALDREERLKLGSPPKPQPQEAVGTSLSLANAPVAPPERATDITDVLRQAKIDALVQRASTKFSESRASMRESAAQMQLPWRTRARLLAVRIIHEVTYYSLPLLAGILVALIWSNTDSGSYDTFVSGYWSATLTVPGRPHLQLNPTPCAIAS